MKIEEILKEAQYSRINIGDRWLVWTSEGWVVLERKHRQKITRTIIKTFWEDEAVYHLLQGEKDLYDDVITRAKKDLKQIQAPN